MDTYRVIAVRSGDWWAIEAHGVAGVLTQARRLEEVEGMARDAIALVLDVAPDSFDVAVFVHAPSVQALQAHAEAMADALEDLCFCVHDDAMWERSRQVWQAYVDWHADSLGLSADDS